MFESADMRDVFERLRVKFASKSKPEPVIEQRTCNRHNDCDKADAELLARNPGKQIWQISANFHCHDECCEECFGY